MIRKKAKTKNKMLLMVAAVILVVVCIVGGLIIAGMSGQSGVATESELRDKMADASVTKISVMKDLVLNAPLEVKGNKVLYGEGSITAGGDRWTGDEYMILVPSGAQLTVQGAVSINADGITGGIHAAEGAVWSIEETASVKNASAGAASTLVEGTFHMNGGVLSGAKGHNVRNLGEVTLSAGEVIGSGAKYAGIYNEGVLTQKGGTVRNAYNNVSVISGSFDFTSGSNQSSIGDGIYVAEGAKLSVTDKSAVITASGVRGIYLCGDATIGGIALSSTGDSLIKVAKTGTLNFSGGTLNDSGYHSIENAGKLVMTGGTISNSYNCGIVNTGHLEVTGGSFMDNVKNKAILNKHNGQAIISGAEVMFSGNRFAVANEDTATLDLTGAGMLLTTGTNVYAYDGTVNIHDISLGASGSNNIRIYRADVSMTNVQVLGNSKSGSATTHGILLEGGTLKAKDVTIKNVTGYGIRNKGGQITAENLLINNSIKAGGINNTVQDHTGLPGIADITNLTIAGIRYNNLVVDGGTLTVTNGQLMPSGTNNTKITAGTLTLKNVDILGNLMDSDGRNHAVYATGGTIEAENVKISNGKFSGLRVDGDTAVINGTNVTISDCGEYAIDQSRGQICFDGLTTENNHYNIGNHGGTIKLCNSTMGATISNNVRINGGEVDLQNVVVNGHAEGHVSDVHALFVSGGTLTGGNITVQNVSNAGLRVKTGTANLQGLTVNDAGADGVWISEGNATITNLVVKKAEHAGVSATGSGNITVNGGSISNTKSHGVKSEDSAKLTLQNISVAISLTKDRNGVLAQGGDVHLENVKITGHTANTDGAGIRINKDTSHVSGKDVRIAGVPVAIKADAGTSDISGVRTENITNQTVLATNTAKLLLSDSEFGISGTNSVKAENKGTITLKNSVVLGTKTNHGIIVENDGWIYGKNLTVRDTKGSAVRVVCSANGSHVEIDGLITENIGEQNIYINSKDDAASIGSIVIKNGDLGLTARHSVQADAGELILQDTNIQGHKSGAANNIHAIFACQKTPKVKLERVTVLDAAGDALRISAGEVVANDFTSNQAGRNGIWADGGKLTGENITVGSSKEIGVRITAKAVAQLNGVDISGSGSNNIDVSGAELVINGYADGSKSRIGTAPKDNVVVTDAGSVRLNHVNVLESAANNIVATGAKVYVTDSTVTGGNYSILAQTAGYAELTNTTITDSVKDGIRVNAADGEVVVNNVQICNPVRYGVSAEKGAVSLVGGLTITNDAGVSRAIYAYDGGKVTGKADAQVSISGTEHGIYLESNAAVSIDNVTISGCAANAVKVTSGTAVLNGVNISESRSNNILVSGGELTVNGYTDGSKSRIGTAKEDNIRVSAEGVIRLNAVDVQKTSKNNLVAIDGGTVYMDNSSVTGGNHSVLAQDGKVTLNNVTILSSATSAIRANRAGSEVEAAGVVIDGAKTGLSIERGTVNITNITIRNTVDVGVSVAQGTSAANVTLNNLVAENCGSNAIYTSGVDAKLTVNGATLGNDGSDHVINLNGGPLVLNDVTIHGENLASGKYELFSGAGWLTIGGAMDADVYIATNPGRVIKVNKELTGDRLSVDWKTTPTGNALEFTNESMANASKDNIRLGATQNAVGACLIYETRYAKLSSNVVTSESQLLNYLNLAVAQNMTDVTVRIGAGFTVANQVTVPATITGLTLQDDGNTATENVVSYTGDKDGLFLVKDGLKLTLKDISLNSTKKILLQQDGGELIVDHCVLDGANKNIYQSNGKLTIRNSTLKLTTSNNVTVKKNLTLEGNIQVEAPTTAENVHGLYLEDGNVTVSGNVTVTGSKGAAIQCVNHANVTLEKTGSITINGGGRAGLLISHQATMTVNGSVNVSNTTGPAIVLGYWGGTNLGTLIVANGGSVTVGKDANGNGIANIGIQIRGKGTLDVREGGSLGVSDTAKAGIEITETGVIKLAGNVNASIVSKSRPIEVNGALTGTLTISWSAAPAGSAITFASEAIMNAFKESVARGDVQIASYTLHYSVAVPWQATLVTAQ